MNFLKMFLRSIALVPSLVQGVEALYGAQTGAQTGAQKREAAVAMVGSAIHVADALADKTIVDPEKFAAALGTIVDGVVACLNASIWAGKQA